MFCSWSFFWPVLALSIATQIKVQNWIMFAGKLEYIFLPWKPDQRQRWVFDRNGAGLKAFLKEFAVFSQNVSSLIFLSKRQWWGAIICTNRTDFAEPQICNSMFDRWLFFWTVLALIGALCITTQIKVQHWIIYQPVLVFILKIGGMETITLN